MSDGLFAIACPHCGSALAIDTHGIGSCASCAHTYAPRFGVLVPLDAPGAPETEPTDLPPFAGAAW